MISLKSRIKKKTVYDTCSHKLQTVSQKIITNFPKQLNNLQHISLLQKTEREGAFVLNCVNLSIEVALNVKSKS